MLKKVLEIVRRSYGIDLAPYREYLDLAGEQAHIVFGRHHQRFILGLGSPGQGVNIPNAPQATFSARVASAGLLPHSFLVIEVQEDGALVCLDANDGGIVRWTPEAGRDLLSPGFAEYVDVVRRDTESFDHGFDKFSEHVEEFGKRFGYDRQGNGQLPYDRHWRPYRSCVQDVLVGATVLRYQPAGNLIEVDVFLTAEVPELEPLAGARALALFLLGEAVRCGTTMDIRFTDNVEGRTVPLALRQLASHKGVEVGAEAPDAITPNEAVGLSIALTDFKEEVKQRLSGLIRTGKATPERLCFATHQGTWSIPEIELLMAAPDPARILTGSVPAWQRLLHAEDARFARAAVLAGRLLRALERREADASARLQRKGQSEDGESSAPAEERDSRSVEETEDRTRRLDVRVDTGLLGLHIAAPPHDSFPLTWRTEGCEPDQAETLSVLIRPFNDAEIAAYLRDEIEACARWGSSPELNHPLGVLIPDDYNLLDGEQRRNLEKFATEKGVLLLVSRGTLHEIDIEIEKRSRRGRLNLAS